MYNVCPVEKYGRGEGSAVTEQRFGFIHDKLDTKVLILYVLHRLPSRIDAEKLADLVLIDGGIGYFDYKQCLCELIENSQVDETDEGCLITAKGSRNCEILADSLPYSCSIFRQKCSGKRAIAASCLSSINLCVPSKPAQPVITILSPAHADGCNDLPPLSGR